MPLVTTARGDLWYAEHKRKSARTPLVLIHGAGGNRFHWPAALRHLEDTWVIAPELPGHGNTPGTGRDSIAGYAQDILALLDALNISRAIIGGHSMGGAIAQWLALEHAKRLSGLLLVSTAAKMSVHPDLLNGFHRDLDKTIALLMDWMWGVDLNPKLYQQGFEQIKACGADILYGDFKACNEFDVRARLGEIHTPTLIINGTADKLIAAKYVQALQAAIPNAQQVAIEDAGHMVMLQKPDVVAKAVRDWLAVQQGTL